jgi:hypothetical protein
VRCGQVEFDSRTKVKWSRTWMLKNAPLLELLFGLSAPCRQKWDFTVGGLPLLEYQ